MRLTPPQVAMWFEVPIRRKSPALAFSSVPHRV